MKRLSRLTGVSVIVASLLNLVASSVYAFSDIQTHWAKGCITQLEPRNLVAGYPDGTFRPGLTITRAEFAALMLNAFPKAPIVRRGMTFEDVPIMHWAYKVIQEAYKRGFFTGYPGGNFQPSEPITRVQAIGVLAGALNYSIPSNPDAILQQNYFDAAAIPNYARKAVAAASVNNLVVNYPNRNQLNPNQQATRGEIAALLCRGLNIYAVAPQYIAGVEIYPQQVRSLPGKLDTVAVFNSNSPELVRTEGILLSTFPPTGKTYPSAHLNYAFNGRFDIFSHHIARAETEAETNSVYQGIILHNPGTKPVRIEVLQAASYLGAPDAPYISLPDSADNLNGNVYSGPGSRVMTEILRGVRQEIFPPQLLIPPGESRMLMNLPIPLIRAPGSNGRSTMMRLQSDGEVYIANLIEKANQPPSLADWQQLLNTGKLAEPRGEIPTPLEPPKEPTVFGRVAGVSQGSRWTAIITDEPKSEYLSIPPSGSAVSYVLGTLHLITLGTKQIQSAKMQRRYADTAYFAHSNYGVEYNLTLPLKNSTARAQTVTVLFQTPLKDEGGTNRLLFVNPQDERIFFRGTVRVKYPNEQGVTQTRYLHLVQRRGQPGSALVTLTLLPNAIKPIEVDFIYPPDVTPPQVLTVKTF